MTFHDGRLLKAAMKHLLIMKRDGLITRSLDHEYHVAWALFRNINVDRDNNHRIDSDRVNKALQAYRALHAKAFHYEVRVPAV